MKTIELRAIMLEDILYDFQTYTQDDLYEKMPYQAWKKLKNMTKDDWSMIKVEYRADLSAFIFTSSDSSETIVLAFYIDDNSFGSYLHDNWYKTWSSKPNVEEEVIRYDINGFPISASKAGKPNPKKEENKKGETSNMKNLFSFEFGPVNSSMAKMSMYGLAIQNNDGVYVSYNPEAKEIVNVDVFNFDGSQFLYRMPVAIKDIAVGDIVIHNKVPMIVVEKPAHAKTLFVIDPVCGERKEIMLTRSPFGFNFVTKIVNFCGDMFTKMNASEDNPFGNMWMLAAMSEGSDFKDILPMMMIQSMGQKSANPMQMMILMAMMKDGGSEKSDMLSTMMMMQFMNQNFTEPEHICKCGGHCQSENK